MLCETEIQGGVNKGKKLPPYTKGGFVKPAPRYELDLFQNVITSSFDQAVHT